MHIPSTTTAPHLAFLTRLHREAEGVLRTKEGELVDEIEASKRKIDEREEGVSKARHEVEHLKHLLYLVERTDAAAIPGIDLATVAEQAA